MEIVGAVVTLADTDEHRDVLTVLWQKIRRRILAVRPETLDASKSPDGVRSRRHVDTTLLCLQYGQTVSARARNRRLCDLDAYRLTVTECACRLVSPRAFQFGLKKKFRFDSIRQSDKFAACTLIFK